MKGFEFPIPFRHDHPPIRNVNEILEEKASFGQAAADAVARVAGSWPFIVIQSTALVVWIALNAAAIAWRWDPYPFILLNLMLSLQAAYAAPIIMMSQNRQTERDRIEAHNDFLLDQKAEVEIRAVLDHLAAQDRALEELRRLIERLDKYERSAGGP